jgi:hypothetical protein
MPSGLLKQLCCRLIRRKRHIALGKVNGHFNLSDPRGRGSGARIIIREAKKRGSSYAEKDI